ncbi:MAG: YbeD family protein [Oceanobacter sp.]
MTLIRSDGKDLGAAAEGTPEAPKIEFPCENYPVKIVGVGHDDYQQIMLEIVEVHAPGVDVTRIQMKESSKGRFQSMTVYITATGPDQLEALHQDLIAHDLVKMVI